jgi:glycopeptide antibiotics resistance protein
MFTLSCTLTLTLLNSMKQSVIFKNEKKSFNGIMNLLICPDFNRYLD